MHVLIQRLIKILSIKKPLQSLMLLATMEKSSKLDEWLQDK